MADGTALTPPASADAAERPSVADELDALLGDAPARADIRQRAEGFERYAAEQVPPTAQRPPPSAAPPTAAPPRPSSRRSAGGGAAVWLTPLALVVLTVLGLVLALGTRDENGAGHATAASATAADPADVLGDGEIIDDLADVVGDGEIIDDPADDMMMLGTTGMMDDGGMEYRAPSSAAVAPRADRLPSGETRVAVEAYGRTYTFPRTLSRSTSVGMLRHRVLAGRDVVEFEARDGRWATTYYWEYGAGAAHFVASDGRLTNVSREAGSEAVLRAALGYVPERTFRTAEERAAERRASAPSAVVGPTYVLLGSYRPHDAAGFEERRRRVAASGRAIQTALSDDLGLPRGGYRVLYLGPYDRATAERIRDEMRAYTSDAYVRTIGR